MGSHPGLNCPPRASPGPPSQQEEILAPEAKLPIRLVGDQTEFKGVALDAYETLKAA